MADLKYLTIDHLDTKTIARLFSSIAVDPATGCWNWNGRENGHGYGRTYLRGHQESVHRVMFAWLVERLPRGLARHIPQLDHVICTNRRCANPSHTVLTSARNNALRGDGPCAEHSRQTHCKRGHLLSPDNLLNEKGRPLHRHCKICARDNRLIWKREWRRKRGIKERPRRNPRQPLFVGLPQDKPK